MTKHTYSLLPVTGLFRDDIIFNCLNSAIIFVTEVSPWLTSTSKKWQKKPRILSQPFAMSNVTSAIRSVTNQMLKTPRNTFPVSNISFEML